MCESSLKGLLFSEEWAKTKGKRTQYYRMSSINFEEISRRLSHTLNCIGYSHAMIKKRKYLYNCIGRLSNDSQSPSNVFLETKTVGSRGEGLVKMFESDWDRLILLTRVLAVEDYVVTEDMPETMSLFYMVPCRSNPGYFKLLLIKQGKEDSFTGGCLNPIGNICWLSSKKFLNQGTDDSQTVSGPARTSTRDDTLSHDIVRTFRCDCPSIIRQWIQRPRRYNWPPIELRQRISKMSANLVPTGHEPCPDKEIEWRLCFNEIELLLIESWNDTQGKLYKVLKMMAKDVFVRAGFDISSYMMKNIVLWVSEVYPLSDFETECLMNWIMKSLRLLLRAVKAYNLPFYMIPERNLMSERIQKCKRRSLMREILSVIHCGPKLLWECRKLEFSMSMTPNELRYFKKKCDRLDVLCTVRFIITDNVGSKSNFLREISEIVNNSQWPAAVRNILQDKTDLFEILQLLVG